MKRLFFRNGCLAALAVASIAVASFVCTGCTGGADAAPDEPASNDPNDGTDDAGEPSSGAVERSIDRGQAQPALELAAGTLRPAKKDVEGPVPDPWRGVAPSPAPAPGEGGHRRP